MDEAVEQLYRADMVFSVGSRTGFPSCAVVQDHFGKIPGWRPVFRLIPGRETFSNVMKVTEHSVGIGDFHGSVFKATYPQFIQQAKARGASIILVTDGQISPPALLAVGVPHWSSRMNRNQYDLIHLSFAQYHGCGPATRGSHREYGWLKVLETLLI